MFCSMCGKEIKDNVKFCKYCGTPQQIFSEMSEENHENNNSTEIEGVNKKSGAGGVIAVVVIMAIIVTYVIVWFANNSRICDRCGNNIMGIAYYDALDYEEIMCEDCAKEYYAPFPYTGYKVR